MKGWTPYSMRAKALTSWGAFVFAVLASAASPGRAGPRKPDCLPAALHMLLETATAWDDRRGPALLQEWMGYKNGPNPTPRTVDLSDSCLGEPCAALNDMRQVKAGAGERTIYEREVLRLKRGDTVVFDGKAFVLGRFLGAGNSTHVFEVAGQDTVIRIPYLIDPILDWFVRFGLTSNDRYKKTLERHLSAMKLLRASKGTPEIRHVDPSGRFAIVDKVHGSQTGEALLQSLLVKEHPPIQEQDRIFPASALKSPALMSATEKMKVDRLIELMILNGHTEGRPDGVFALIGRYVRQYVWDEDLSRWFLVDGA